MKLPPLSLLLAALPALLSACASVPADATTAPGPGSYTLRPNERATVDAGATLTFDSVSDSRCPASVKCIWAGELVYRFTLATPKATESFALGPAKPAYISEALKGARIALDPHALPATPKAGAAPQQQSVTLTVSRP
jgi:hypothetical protein